MAAMVSRRGSKVRVAGSEGSMGEEASRMAAERRTRRSAGQPGSRKRQKPKR
jgi:hypothetical protein